ncbi:MAG TPA: hypothetical protein VFC92_02145 [Bacteroidales bacterium]|jgi:hypothetical protein|nr:hypothetical protein [Bacteroidales bacterium]
MNIKIVYDCDKKAYRFIDVVQVLEGIRQSGPLQGLQIEQQLKAPLRNMLPEHSCQGCHLLPGDWKHTLFVSIQGETASQIFLAVKVLLDFCTYARYRVELFVSD